MNTNRFVTLALGTFLLASPAYLAAQQDQGQESVAEAARKAQAEKKNAPKPKMVIDNDNLGTLSGAVNVVGERPAAPADQTKKPEDDKTPKAGGPAKDEAYWRQKFADANKKLNDDAHELDIMQREYNLKQQQFYTDPMASLKQEYSRQDLNDSKAKIDEKTAQVAQDKADIANLEDELRQAGGDPGWATPASQPAPAPAPQP
jgi:chromosome segregation ATPase